MTICTLYSLLIQEKAISVRLKPSDASIAACKPHGDGSLVLGVQKGRHHCWLVVSSDNIRCLEVICTGADNYSEVM